MLIAFDAAQLRENGSDIAMALGEERWIPAGSAVTLQNIGSLATEFLRFEFKTPPAVSSSQE